MKFIVIPNLLFQYIKISDTNENNEEKERFKMEKIDCIKCGFRMGEVFVGNLKCFKCGSELN